MIDIHLAVFDMDGCLYSHKDPDHHLRDGFYETFLGKAVLASIIELISVQEIGDPQEVFARATLDEVGPSRYLADRYAMTRTEYFTLTWGKLAVEGFIDDEDVARAKEVTRAFQSKGIGLHLLTAAPSVWAQKVLERLELAEQFDYFSYGEDFSKKKEVFEKLVKEFIPTKVLSIGDEYENDILPAQRLGMHTYQVSASNPLSGVIELIS